MLESIYRPDNFHRQEDLGLYGNQLNYMQTCWTVGYVLGEIPSNIMLTRIRPRYWLPALEVVVFLKLAEALLTFSSARMDHSYILYLQSQHRYATVRHPVLRR